MSNKTPENTPVKPAKTPLKNKRQIDGKLPPDIDVMKNVMTLDELIGRKKNGANPYGCDTLEQFEEKVQTMNLADMQSLATQVCIIPNYDRNRLGKNLVQSFRTFLRSRMKYGDMEAMERPTPISTDEAKRKRAEAVMRAGR